MGYFLPGCRPASFTQERAAPCSPLTGRRFDVDRAKGRRAVSLPAQSVHVRVPWCLHAPCFLPGPERLVLSLLHPSWIVSCFLLIFFHRVHPVKFVWVFFWKLGLIMHVITWMNAVSFPYLVHWDVVLYAVYFLRFDGNVIMPRLAPC